ncbi:hypothetical protein AMS68_003990 [Peltaster fructicola]|uniref:Uncharacterized protein n=1 Tax=Peltaster fructicola TaxID=286661 RepID=A0A6H0XUR1_9PEZI|nr:hypothetical protein AMS68_003990 [Peltaster fructicola]
MNLRTSILQLRFTYPSQQLSPQSRLSFQQRRMSALKVHSTKRAAQPIGPYSQAIEVNGQIYVSGQIPADAQGNLVEGSIADKTKASCESLKAILEDAGSSLDRVIKVRLPLALRRPTNSRQTTIFLTSMDSFAEMNGVYGQYFAHKPARSCVAVKELPKGVPVEIEAIALAGRG